MRPGSWPLLSRILKGDEAARDGDGDGLLARFGAQLLAGVAQMERDGRPGNLQLLGNLVIRKPAREPFEALHLAVR